MNARSDTERILDAYLAPEADRLADRVIDAALADIARTPQRRALRVPWRFPLMLALSRATGVALVALVAVVGAGTLFYLNSAPTGGGSQGTPVPTATPTPTPTVAPSVAPSVAMILPLPEATLAAGMYRLRPSSSGTMTVDVTVPDGGWVGAGSVAGPVGEGNGPNGVEVAFLDVQTINSDPCHWDKNGSGSAPQEGDIEVGPTVDDLAQALAANASYESTTPVDATLGGFSGKRLELHLTPDPAGCDTWQGEVDQYFVFGGRSGSLYAQGGANTWQITMVDVEGTRLIALIISYEQTSVADLRAAQRILESVVITP